MSNEKDGYIIYDDFETIYLSKLYLNFGQFAYMKDSPLYEVKLKEFEEKYQDVKEVFVNALNAIRNNQKVIIKKSRNNEIREILITENEFFLYLEEFRSRRNFPTELVTRLIGELRAIHK